MKYQASFKKYKDRASQIIGDGEKVKKLTSQATSYLKSIVGSNARLKEVSEKVYAMIRMLKVQFNGDYRAFSNKTLLMIVGALLYLVTPFDVIPDFLPALGLTDDVAILLWIYESIKEDVENFVAWENTIEIESEPVHEPETPQ